MSGRRINWTDEMLAIAKALRAEGKGLRTIAKALGISHGAVRYRLNPHHRELVLASAYRAFLRRKRKQANAA